MEKIIALIPCCNNWARKNNWSLWYSPHCYYIDPDSRPRESTYYYATINIIIQSTAATTATTPTTSLSLKAPCLTPGCIGLLDQFDFASTISFSPHFQAPQFQAFLATIHTTSEPSSYQEAVQFPKWREAMKRNFAHSATSIWILFLFWWVLHLWVTNGSSRSNIDLMVRLSGTRLTLLPEDLLKSMRLTTMGLLHLLL